MRTKNQLQLINYLNNQLGIKDESELEIWKKKTYLMDKTVTDKFWNYVKNAIAVRIIGDYDVDGVCASYIMAKSIKALYPDKSVGVRIPHRLSEGYGFNSIIADEIREKMPKGSVIITVDNGIAAAKELEKLKQDGYTILVTDHHELGDRKLPNVDMVLDPKVNTNPYAFKGDYWCGAAVAYKIAEQYLSEGLKKELEIFAAIATVGDCMQLREGNWALVKRNVEAIRKGQAPNSVLKLIEGLGQNIDNVTEETFGFYVCPAINAPGRLYDKGAIKSLDYFLKPTTEKCESLVKTNIERRELRDTQFEIVDKYIQDNHLEGNCPIWVAIDGLHEGIVGILAGMVTEKYHVPAIVLTQSEKNKDAYKGSARSVDGINIFKYLQTLDEYMLGYGGHSGAAGLSLEKDKFKFVQNAFIEKPDQVSQKQNVFQIDKREIPDMASITAIYAPFGEGNPAPEFSSDFNLENEPYKMLGKPPVHLCINDPLAKYKILHFYHDPSSLTDKNLFSLTGKIRYDVFRDKKTAVLTADEMEDKKEVENDQELQKLCIL